MVGAPVDQRKVTSLHRGELRCLPCLGNAAFGAPLRRGRLSNSLPCRANPKDPSELQAVLNAALAGQNPESVAESATIVSNQGIDVASSLDAAAAGITATAAAATAAPAVPSLPALDIISAAASFQTLVDQIVSAAPGALKPLFSTFGGDLVDILSLHPTFSGALRLGALYYFIFARPSPLSAILDFYILIPLARYLRPGFDAGDFTLRDKLGSGNYGQVYQGLRNRKRGEPDQLTRELTPEQKARRVVLKKTNLDRSGIRTNFLKSGTMARGAAETGAVEDYMCSRVAGHPTVRPYVANYQGVFIAEDSSGGITAGSQWLVWKFQSDATLGDACNGSLGKFPECLAPAALGERKADALGETDPEKRDALTVKSIMLKLLTGIERLHSLGIVHRDIKPENILITGKGEIIILDFGAACDLSVGINFNPLYGMLDPRYSAPEEVVMPKTFPRPPIPGLAALLAPLAWFYGRPDLFDSYSAGVVLLQMAVPQLRTATGQRGFNADLAAQGYDLAAWRNTSGKARQCDFSMLDRNGGAGWDLACRLVRERGGLNRGRLSAAEAMRHRYFLPEF